MRRFELIAIEKDDKSLVLETKNDGFKATELLGILDVKKDDITRQVKDAIQFDRILVKEYGELKIKEKNHAEN